MMKSSEISNENVSCGHTTLKMDNMDMLANILRLLSGRSGGRWTWSSLFLACRWPPLKSHFVPPFFSCLALIKNFWPSRSKHTTKLTNPILFSWLARDHRHWEVFYKCSQCTMRKLKNGVKSGQLWQIISPPIFNENSPNLEGWCKNIQKIKKIIDFPNIFKRGFLKL